MSSATAPRILLASTSPQRRAILAQLGLPFDVEAPRYVERDLDGASPAELVTAHARGKARSVAAGATGPVLGVDTMVVCDGAVLGKPADAPQAEAMLAALAGRTHEVVSGLCLLTAEWEELHDAVTLVTFRALGEADRAAYIAGGEWRERAGGYAIQGLGARFVERIDGDYLNVVGLPAALLCTLLGTRFPGRYGLG